MLGVHLPDWLGRFVLRAATRDRLRTAQRAYFIARENAPAGSTLAEFLRRFGRETRIDVFGGDAEQFVNELDSSLGLVALDGVRVVGSVRVLVDGPSDESDLVVEARYYAEAPEVDGKIYIGDAELAAGEMVDVRITDAGQYDLAAERA